MPEQYYSPQQQELETLRRGQPQNLMTQPGMTALPVIITAIQRLIGAGPAHQDAQRIRQLEPQVQQQANEYQNYLMQSRAGQLEQQGATLEGTRAETAGRVGGEERAQQLFPSTLANSVLQPELTQQQISLANAQIGNENLRGPLIQAQTRGATAEADAQTSNAATAARNAGTNEGYRKDSVLTQLLQGMGSMGLPTQRPVYGVDKKGKQTQTGMEPTELGQVMQQIVQFLATSAGVPQSQPAPVNPDEAAAQELFMQRLQKRQGVSAPAPGAAVGQAPPMGSTGVPAVGTQVSPMQQQMLRAIQQQTVNPNSQLLGDFMNPSVAQPPPPAPSIEDFINQVMGNLPPGALAPAQRRGY